MQAAVATTDIFTVRRNATASSAVGRAGWDTDAQTSQATYSVSD